MSIADVDKASPEEFERTPTCIYRSLIAAPVHGRHGSVGVLFVDSDRPNSLTDSDADYVVLLAGIIGAGHSHVGTLPRPLTTSNGSATGNGSAPVTRGTENSVAYHPHNEEQ